MSEKPVGLSSDMRQKFVRLMIQGYGQTEAAKLAGYAHPGRSGHALMTQETVKKAIFDGQIRRLSAEILPKALKVIEGIIDDDECNRALRFKAAAYVTDKALELQAMATARDIAEKSPLEMTAAELEIFVMRGRVIVEKEKAKEDLGLVIDHTG